MVVFHNSTLSVIDIIIYILANLVMNTHYTAQEHAILGWSINLDLASMQVIAMMHSTLK